MARADAHTYVDIIFFVVRKSRVEVRKLHLTKHRERHLKERRKREQEDNVARKRREREEHKARSLAGMGEKDEDVEWYKKEVGEEPDPGMLLYTTSSPQVQSSWYDCVAVVCD